MKRSGLSEQTLSALKEALPDLLYKWSPDDWVCAFCNRRPASFVSAGSYQSEIEHALDCLGIQIQNDLEAAE